MVGGGSCVHIPANNQQSDIRPDRKWPASRLAHNWSAYLSFLFVLR